MPPDLPRPLGPCPVVYIYLSIFLATPPPRSRHVPASDTFTSPAEMLLLAVASGALLPMSATTLRPPRQLARHMRMSEQSLSERMATSYWKQKRGFLEAQSASIDFELGELEARESALTAMLTDAHAEIAQLKASSPATHSVVESDQTDGGAAATAALAEAKAALAESEARVAALTKQLAEAQTQAPESSEEQEREHLAALEAAAELREHDVQKVAAFWIDKLASAKAANAAAIESAQVARKTNVQLEEELFSLEAELDAKIDRIDVQQEMITIGSSRCATWGERGRVTRRCQGAERVRPGCRLRLPSCRHRLNALTAALDEANLRHEMELQRTALFWVEKCQKLKADAEKAA